VTDQKAPTEDRLLLVHEAAEFLRLSPGTLRNLVSDGAVPFVKLPTGGLRFRKSALQEWLIEHPQADVA
jgi:excisionase family DNA binding protein